MRAGAVPPRDAYRCEVVYLDTNAAQRREARLLWIAEGVTLSPWEAACRPHEIVVMARSPAGELAGLCTVQPMPLAGEARPYYFYRTFIRRQDRRVTLLMERIHQVAVDFLRGFPHPGGPMAGMLFTVENPRLMRPGMRRRIQRFGYRCLGRLANGREIWRLPFQHGPHEP